MHPGRVFANVRFGSKADVQALSTAGTSSQFYPSGAQQPDPLLPSWTDRRTSMIEVGACAMSSFFAPGTPHAR